jgi:hypothetical protein
MSRFLRAEADGNAYFNDRPFFPGVDDHLHQAADKANWPAGITYDPKTMVRNSFAAYTNIGIMLLINTPRFGTGTGIELVKLLNGSYSGINVNLMIFLPRISKSL